MGNLWAYKSIWRPVVYLTGRLHPKQYFSLGHKHLAPGNRVAGKYRFLFPLLLALKKLTASTCDLPSDLTFRFGICIGTPTHVSPPGKTFICIFLPTQATNRRSRESWTFSLNGFGFAIGSPWGQLKLRDGMCDVRGRGDNKM
jgi:hypothetical protein